MTFNPLFFRYLMPEKVYKKVDIQRNWWSVALWLDKKMYLAEINWNVYHMELMSKAADWVFKCKFAIISKTQKE